MRQALKVLKVLLVLRDRRAIRVRKVTRVHRAIREQQVPLRQLLLGQRQPFLPGQVRLSQTVVRHRRQCSTSVFLKVHKG